jgi:hypothetical protein
LEEPSPKAARASSCGAYDFSLKIVAADPESTKV